MPSVPPGKSLPFILADEPLPRSLRDVLYAKEGEGIPKNGERADTLFVPLQEEGAKNMQSKESKHKTYHYRYPVQLQSE